MTFCFNSLFSTDKTYAHQMIRTDSNEQKLDAFIVHSSQLDEEGTAQMETEQPLTDPVPPQQAPASSPSVGTVSKGKSKKRSSPSTPLQLVLSSKKRKHHKPVHLTSVKNLIKDIGNHQHQGTMVSMVTVVMVTIKIITDLSVFFF